MHNSMKSGPKSRCPSERRIVNEWAQRQAGKVGIALAPLPSRVCAAQGVVATSPRVSASVSHPTWRARSRKVRRATRRSPCNSCHVFLPSPRPLDRVGPDRLPTRGRPARRACGAGAIRWCGCSTSSTQELTGARPGAHATPVLDRRYHEAPRWVKLP